MSKRRVIVIVLLLLTGFGVSIFRDYGFTLDYIALAGDISHQQQAEIASTLETQKENMKALSDVKQILEEIEWVHHVVVARNWPDGLTVNVVPERAIAYWNDKEFINDEGRVFYSPYLAGGDLAQLHGPDGTEREAMTQYLQLSKAVARAGLSVDTLVLDERGALEFTADNGMKVLLGKDDVMERIQRFLLVFESPELAARLSNIKQIDTRYSNGMAVSWKVGNGLDIAATQKAENSQRELRL
jgi:cell division protein FtsQ